MRNVFRSKGSTFTNWITNADGTITERAVKVYTVGDSNSGIYELEICNKFLGLVLETDFNGVHTLVKSLDSKCCDSAMLAAVTVGDVLVSVNNHVMLNEDFEDIIAYFKVLSDADIPRRLRFLNPAVCPVAVYSERLALGKRNKSRTDVYGFVRSAEYLKDEHTFMTSNMTSLSQRDHEWIFYLKSIGGCANLKPFGQYSPTPKLKFMVRRGIPAAFRPLIWKNISLLGHYRDKFPQDYYCSLASRLETHLCPSVQLDISKDVGRTFPDHEVLNSEEGQASIGVVLSTLALHNPVVGYCQSLNFLVGTLLLFLSEEDSFWLLCVITECLLPADNYSASMTGTYLDQHVFEEIVRQRLPAIAQKLDECGLQLSLCSIQWFMCLFVTTLRMEPALRVWDVFLNEGDYVLFRVAVGLLKLNEEAILSCSDFSALHLCLKGLGTSLVDADDLMRVAFEDTGLASPGSAPGASAASAASSKQIGSLLQDISCKSKAVPVQLQGLGVGHLGWSSRATPEHSGSASGSSDDGARDVTMLTPNVTIGPDSSTGNSSSGDGDSDSACCRGGDIRAGDERYLQANALEKENESAAEDCVTELFSVFTPLRVGTSEWRVQGQGGGVAAGGPQRAAADDPNFHCQFTQADVFELRAKYRPEVEERLLGMERNRQQWREERVQRERKAAEEAHVLASVVKTEEGGVATTSSNSNINSKSNSSSNSSSNTSSEEEEISIGGVEEAGSGDGHVSSDCAGSSGAVES